MKAPASFQNPLPEMKIRIYDPLAEYLGGPSEVVRFDLSILDAARLSGHLCPSVAGAFLVSKAAIKALYPDTDTCVRGQIEVDLPGVANEGATGPISNVIGYLTGAWGEHGFAGINGKFSRRELMHFHSPRCVQGAYRFERTDTGEVVHVRYNPGAARGLHDAGTPTAFADAWQARVHAILTSPDVVEVVSERTSRAKNERRFVT